MDAYQEDPSAFAELAQSVLGYVACALTYAVNGTRDLSLVVHLDACECIQTRPRNIRPHPNLLRFPRIALAPRRRRHELPPHKNKR